MTTKAFSLSEVLTITTGRLLCPMERVYAILNHMTGDSLWTHQLPRASRECKPWLLRWFPELQPALSTKSLDKWVAASPSCPEEGCRMWIAELKIMFPVLKDEYEVPRIPRDDHDRIDPFDELVQIRGTDEGIILVDPSDA